LSSKNSVFLNFSIKNQEKKPIISYTLSKNEDFLKYFKTNDNLSSLAKILEQLFFTKTHLDVSKSAKTLFL
jgi:hypothetical protein